MTLPPFAARPCSASACLHRAQRRTRTVLHSAGRRKTTATLTVLFRLPYDEPHLDGPQAQRLEAKRVIAGVHAHRGPIEPTGEGLAVHRYPDGAEVLAVGIRRREDHGGHRLVDLGQALGAVVAHDGRTALGNANKQLGSRSGELARLLAQRLGGFRLLPSRIHLPWAPTPQRGPRPVASAATRTREATGRGRRTFIASTRA